MRMVEGLLYVYVGPRQGISLEAQLKSVHEWMLRNPRDWTIGGSANPRFV